MIVEHDAAHGYPDEEEENYFISMTDMMVGILFIFIIMLMIFALNFRQKADDQIQITQEQLKRIQIVEEVAEQINRLQVEVRQNIADLSHVEQVRGQLLAKIQERLEKENIKVTIDQKNGVLRLNENAVRFAADRSDLTAEAARNVDAIARALAATLPSFSACATDGPADCDNTDQTNIETVFVEGHTDVTGTDNRNWQLSTERAVNTYRRLITSAPVLKTLKNSEDQEILSVSGYSSTRPAALTQDSASYARNRRIDLRFVMESERRKRLEAVTQLLSQMEARVDQLIHTPATNADLPIRGTMSP
ncbi:OmpA/MotB family protein [Jiella marina]|uniref:OmpA/MotB family protein n=1 Tax=Jiella sp. LLJ827 TaxID=2917712 RepID=UPI0021017DAE|nr:OmpA family protein [Jiella sp. LLJ827]MCQ0987167.1 OmpA family protein [Jiella sp. LLJ827]